MFVDVFLLGGPGVIVGGWFGVGAWHGGKDRKQKLSSSKT
jgi:hypothetical protein